MLPQRLRETQTYQRVRAFTQRYERFLMPGMLLGGTALDAVQFRLLQIQTTFMFVGVYALLCIASMAVMAAKPPQETRLLRYAKIAAPLLQQFTIGALLSTSLLFYWFSGALSASWPVVGVIALLMVSNEVLRKFFIRTTVQVVVFYFAFFSLAATFAAYMLNSISPFAFVAGGVASLVVMGAALVVVIRIGDLGHRRKTMWLSVAAVFALMNTAYFLNLIPPIPLSLRDAGMYHDIVVTNGEYTLVGEAQSWIDRLLPGQTVHLTPGYPLYAYTAISAPTDLSAVMVHRWEYYDDETHNWETSSALSFRISGGRSEGYRGYSLKRQLTEGKWRVSVETTRGQVLGRIRFTIVSTP